MSDEEKSGVEIRLFLSNIPYRASERDIEKFVAPVGEVISVTFPRDEDTQLRRGYVFATVRLKPELNEEAAWAMLDGCYMQHPGSAGTARKVTVRKATRRRDKFSDEGGSGGQGSDGSAVA